MKHDYIICYECKKIMAPLEEWRSENDLMNEFKFKYHENHRFICGLLELDIPDDIVQND